MRRSLLAAASAAFLSLSAPVRAAQTDGAALFAQNCSACHQASGRGIPGAFPALAGDSYVKGDPHPLVKTLLNGRGGMPRFGDQLTDAQIAAVLTYVRGAWGNAAPPLKPALVASLRTTPASPTATAGQQAH